MHGQADSLAHRMDTTHSLNAALAGRYEIEREIGRGGMATVYLARDVKHDRRVAVKVLNPELGAVLGSDRFLSEIRVTANLQHPNLLPLFDSGEANGLLFYVMPFIEGESLRARLDREMQLPIDEAIRIATAIADALDYAHQHGIIHRDLKPENILLQHGQPMVADFGIALAVTVAGGARITQTGLSLGTPQYMSPEQATGSRGIDARTDVYSLGAITYEMLAGEPPHTGASAQAIIARLMTEDPRPLQTVRRSVPPHVEDAVQRALEKLPADRFATAKAFVEALRNSNAMSNSTRGARAANHDSRVARGVVWVAVVIAVSSLSALGWAIATLRAQRGAAVGGPVTRVRVPIEGQLFGYRPLAISPDGRLIAFAATLDSGPRQPRIYIRRADALEIRALPGTEAGQTPQFSPDGGWIAFRRVDSLLKVPVAGGSPVLISGGVGSSYSWSRDDRVFFTPSDGSIYEVPAVGGQAHLVLKSPASSVYRWPELLPNGTTLLVGMWWGVGDSSETQLIELSTGKVQTLVRDGYAAHYLPTGHVLYRLRNGALVAAPFDVRNGRLTSPAIPVVQFRAAGVAPRLFYPLSVSDNGSAIYETGASGPMSLYVVRPGAPPQRLALDVGEERGIRISPDGRHIAYGSDNHLFVHDLALGTSTPVLPKRSAWDPVWSRDGSLIAFHSLEPGTLVFQGYTIAADGAGQVHRLFKDSSLSAPESWLSDGRLIVLGDGVHNDRSRGADLFMLTFRSDSVVVAPYLRADWDESHATVAPNDRWVAFVSDETGRREVYVRPLSDPGAGKWQISERGGNDPVWSRDGGSLYYWEGPEFRVARVRTQREFAILRRETVFVDSSYVASCCVPNYDVYPDGQRFVIARREGANEQKSFILVTNWFEELKARMTDARTSAARAPP